MINKEFVPYQESLELKELGFDEPCLSIYDKDKKLQRSLLEYPIINSKNGFHEFWNIITAPLYQQAFRWFREKKLSDSYVYRYQDRTDGSINFGYSIIHDYGIEETRFVKENYTSYEEAELACLRKLIEIVKQK